MDYEQGYPLVYIEGVHFILSNLILKAIYWASTIVVIF